MPEFRPEWKFRGATIGHPFSAPSPCPCLLPVSMTSYCTSPSLEHSRTRCTTNCCTTTGCTTTCYIVTCCTTNCCITTCCTTTRCTTNCCKIICFLTGISTPPNPLAHVTPRRLCSGRLRPGSASAQVCSGLLTHLTRNRQLLTRSPKRPPLPARGPKSVPIVRSFPDIYYPGLPVFCLQVVLRRPLRFG